MWCSCISSPDKGRPPPEGPGDGARQDLVIREEVDKDGDRQRPAQVGDGGRDVGAVQARRGPDLTLHDRRSKGGRDLGSNASLMRGKLTNESAPGVSRRGRGRGSVAAAQFPRRPCRSWAGTSSTSTSLRRRTRPTGSRARQMHTLRGPRSAAGFGVLPWLAGKGCGGAAVEKQARARSAA